MDKYIFCILGNLKKNLIKIKPFFSKEWCGGGGKGYDSINHLRNDHKGKYS